MTESGAKVSDPHCHLIGAGVPLPVIVEMRTALIPKPVMSIWVLNFLIQIIPLLLEILWAEFFASGDTASICCFKAKCLGSRFVKLFQCQAVALERGGVLANCNIAPQVPLRSQKLPIFLGEAHVKETILTEYLMNVLHGLLADASNTCMQAERVLWVPRTAEVKFIVAILTICQVEVMLAEKPAQVVCRCCAVIWSTDLLRHVLLLHVPGLATLFLLLSLHFRADAPLLCRI
mmetsp:Transcript_40080/g.76851  ORF Transcript_40080/g.76851 Transcript_40080/m.76851 type:complete len:233 (-) Transcript_40080:430-1128(-)